MTSLMTWNRLRWIILAASLCYPTYKLYRHLERQILMTWAWEDRLKEIAERGEMCSPSNPLGSGLQGEYFVREKLQGTPELVRPGLLIDIDVKKDWPQSKKGSLFQSARWMGWIKPPTSGEYVLHQIAGGVKVTFAKQVIFENKKDYPVKLDAGHFYPLEVEIVRLADITSKVELQWTTPYGSRYILPKTMLFPPATNIAPISK